MFKAIEFCEKLVVVALILMMIVAVLLATVELGWIMIRQIMTPPYFLLSIQELFELFGFFMMVLIGIELLQSIKMYITHNQIHVEVVFMVAMIAIARKVIILNLHETSGISLLGLAAIISALAAGYFLVGKADKSGSVLGPAK